jgi:hypothetical protein
LKPIISVLQGIPTLLAPTALYFGTEHGKVSPNENERFGLGTFLSVANSNSPDDWTSGESSLPIQSIQLDVEGGVLRTGK